MVTTEISQVPLSGVLALLKAAKRANVLSVLDLDVPPKVAVEEAMLGSLDEVVECVMNADVLKPTQEAAEDILALISGKGKERKRGSLRDVTWELAKLCGCKLLAMTNGSEGSILTNAQNLVEVEAPLVSKVIDTTGAGDAFLGGLITQLKTNGLPNTTEELRTVGQVANAYGAACTQSVGGVPVPSSYATIKGYLPDSLAVSLAQECGNQATGPLGVFSASINRDLEGLQGLGEGLDWTTVRKFLDTIEQCEGQVILSGIGKSGQVAQRFSSSLSSIGVVSQFVHATEWSHGDLGKVRPGKDVVLMVSHSGNTQECVLAAKQLLARGITTVAITGSEDSLLKHLSIDSLVYPHKLQEPFGCLPTSSIVLQDVVLNAILSELIHRRGVTKETFKFHHPGGSIGNHS